VQLGYKVPQFLKLKFFSAGLFSYHISTNTWEQILVDCAHSSASNPDVLSIKSRVTHSMLFHHVNWTILCRKLQFFHVSTFQKQRKLYIFGGQRGKDYIMDMQTFDVDSQEVCAISDGNNEASKNVPQAGFTQRATIDCDKNEIYVLTVS
jgi:muskelin